MRVLPVVLAIASLSLVAGCAKKGGGEGSEGLPPVATAEEALAQLPEQYRTADLENGRAKFAFCRSCHTITDGGPNGVGPNLYRVFGRKAGSKADYKYSDAVKNSGFVWDAEHLDHWLAKPKDYLPGTKMTFVGLPQEKDRIDLIAYLKVETGTVKPK
jgi:cytochrome c